MSIGTVILLLLLFIAGTILYLASLLSKVSTQYFELTTYLAAHTDLTPLITAQKDDINLLLKQAKSTDERFEDLSDFLTQVLTQIKLSKESMKLVDARLVELSPVIMNAISILKSLEKSSNEDAPI